MAKPKRIVVDASVARSAGSSRNPGDSSSACREALSAVGEIHRLAFSQEIAAEWRRHRSSYARGWYRMMVARRKVDHIDNAEIPELRERVEAIPDMKVTERRAMLEDIHLLEASLATDRIVISRDEIVRALFRRLAEAHTGARRVHWANPDVEAERVTDWLRGGARIEVGRTLGASGR